MMGYGFGGGIGMMIFWIAIIIFVAYFIIEFFRKDPSNKVTRRPLDILNDRLASGEISRDKYVQLKNELTSI